MSENEELNRRVLCAKTLKDVIGVYESYYPELIVDVIDDVCDVYANSVRKNWLLYCNMMHTNKGVVVIVNSKYEDDTSLNTLYDMLISQGALVRKNTEFVRCAGCNLATPTESYHKLLVGSNKPKWNSSCVKSPC